MTSIYPGTGIKGGFYEKRLLLASLSAAAFGGILSVNAADMPVYTLDQVVVTAARTEEKQIDTNASVSVVTSKQIAQKHFNDVSEALRAVPGVVLGNYSASGQNYSSNKVFINGSSNVVILVDGMRRNTNGVSGSAVNLGTLTDMASIERIEVLKGSASTLYGSDAQGGVINIITKKPKIDEVHTTIGAGFGNNSTENTPYTTKARREIYSGPLTPANIFRAPIKTAGAGKSSAT